MTDTTWTADTVLMPVPLTWAPQMADHLARLRAGEVAASAHAAFETVTVSGQGEWSEPMVHKLADATPYAGVLALLDRCAEAASRWIIKSEIEQTQGISAIQLRNELGALSKLTKKLHGKPIWPMQYKKERGSYYYRMDDPVAQWWIDARSAS